MTVSDGVKSVAQGGEEGAKPARPPLNPPLTVAEISVDDQRSFRGGTRGSADPIVDKLSERIGTALPLLKCLGTPKCTI